MAFEFLNGERIYDPVRKALLRSSIHDMPLNQYHFRYLTDAWSLSFDAGYEHDEAFKHFSVFASRSKLLELYRRHGHKLDPPFASAEEFLDHISSGLRVWAAVHFAIEQTFDELLPLIQVELRD